MGRRLNIGLVIDDIDNFFSNQAAIGAEQAAKALDANLFVFPDTTSERLTADMLTKNMSISTIRSSIFLRNETST